MPAMRRNRTKYPGVYYIEGKRTGVKGTEKIFYIHYRRNGKRVEEKAGRQYENDMTAAKAARVRAARIEGEATNREQRQKTKEKVWTIGKLWDEYKKTIPDKNGSDNSRWSKHLEPKFENKKPEQITRQLLSSFLVAKEEEYSPQTCKHIMNLLRRILNFGVREQYIDHVAVTVPMPKVDNIKDDALNPEQLKSLLETLDATPYTTAANMMRLALFTGMRRGEIFKLKWNDIDFEKGFITIMNPKGGKTQTIPMNTAAAGLLESIPEKFEYVFPTRGGGPRKDISKDLRAIREEAGLSDTIRPLHSLRVTFASLLASSGKVDMYTLQKLLTHKSPQMTQRYAHLRDETLKKGSENIADILKNSFK